MSDIDYRKVLRPVSPKDIAGRLKKSIDELPVRPYVSLKNLNHSGGVDPELSDPKVTAIEVGLKFTF